MEIIEGNIRVGTRPVVTVSDKPLSELSDYQVQTVILNLLKRVDTLRKQNEHLKSRLQTAWDELDKEKEKK